MASKRVTFLIGLGASVAVHAALIAAMLRYAEPAAAVPTRRPTTVATLTVLPDPPKPERENPQHWGEAGGQGEAINSSPGEQPQASPRVLDDQAGLTRDPTGDRPGKAPEPTPAPPKPLAEPVSVPPPAALPTPPPSPLTAFRSPTRPTRSSRNRRPSRSRLRRRPTNPGPK